jgi:mannopine transport system ATP-binding protein
MVFQQFALFPHLTVAGNVEFGLRMRRVSRAERSERVAAALALVQMSHFASRYPKSLSGGQQQRVALARAIVVEPDVLLLDEPLSNLDAKLRQSLRDELVLLHRRLGLAMLYVTHDQEEAMVMSDIIAVMNEGRLVQMGTPRDLYQRPNSPFVADFIGRANFIPGEFVESTSGKNYVRVGNRVLCAARLAGQSYQNAPCRLWIRPDRIRLLPDDGAEALSNTLSGTIETRSFAGSIVRYRVRLGNETVVSVEASPESSLESFPEGGRVTLVISAEDVTVFIDEK